MRGVHEWACRRGGAPRPLRCQYITVFSLLTRACCDHQGILLLARMAGMLEEQEGRPHKQQKLATKSTDSAAGGAGAGGGKDEEGGGSDGEEEDRQVIFKYLTPSDLRLTPEALVSTRKSHFRCNVNGCPRDYRSHTALARHRKGKHEDWGAHESHSANDQCSLQAECKEGHCGGEHHCQSEDECLGAQPHCHEGSEWPPAKEHVFQCPERTCAYTAGYVQSLRYHYMRTHGDQARFRCEKCNKSFALKSDFNRHVTSCVLGYTCECGKLLRTVEGLETHRRIFHRKEGGKEETKEGATEEMKEGGKEEMSGALAQEPRKEGAGSTSVKVDACAGPSNPNQHPHKDCDGAGAGTAALSVVAQCMAEKRPCCGSSAGHHHSHEDKKSEGATVVPLPQAAKPEGCKP